LAAVFLSIRTNVGSTPKEANPHGRSGLKEFHQQPFLLFAYFINDW